ncbi:anti-anti-sigma factor [Halopseudomonas bauzanensis]|uniref:Anti-anti-sigma factor n=2 Tax=Halopseudomonas bauzanensis TaxID=653930 RepID=A0A1I4N9V0_9GAMM|nr:anti-anti-sigma factor [Halopseudomonas bauzanensis]SFM12146.1 anti-anti-sigma factor [Halopseudomonas bauzanensis]
MMTTGRIQFAESESTFILKFIGDVRLTLCAALDAYIEKIFSSLNFSCIVIDLTETDNIDSTSLGLLAKLSILSRDRVGLLPTLVSTHEDMNRLLQSMGFDQIFNIVTESTPTDTELQDLPGQVLSEEQVKSRVLEAHRILMNLNEHNRSAFTDLVSTLESGH